MVKDKLRGAFFLSERNRRVLSWVGGGLVALATGLWTIFVHFEQDASSEATKKPVVTTNGGVFIGHDAIGSRIVNH